MIRTFLEYLISRSLDEGKSPPAWLQSLAQRDTQLGEFTDQASSLDSALRDAAAQQRRSMSSKRPIASVTLPPHRDSALSRPARASGNATKWFAGIAAAAVLLVIFTPAILRPTQPEVHAGDFSQQLTAVPGEVLRVLNSAAETSQTQLPQLSPLTNLSMPELPVWEDLAMTVESPVRRELDVWQASWQNLKSRLPGSAQAESTQEL